jgi:hypothetical protein
MGAGYLFPEIKRRKKEADNSFSSTAEGDKLQSHCLTRFHGLVLN